MPRLFIGARLPLSLMPALKEASESLRAASHRLSPVPLDALHLTLRFIGEVEEGMAERVRAWFLSLPAPRAAECLAALDRYDCFPSRDGLILWAGLACGPGIADFKGRVDEGLTDFGFPPDDQAFVPHVTLARRARLLKPLEELAPKLPLVKQAVPVPAFALFDSARGPDGPHYRALAEIKLI